MGDETVWGIHTGRPRGSVQSEQHALTVQMDELFKGGTVAIGWPQLGDLSDVPADREAFKQRFAEVNSDQPSRSIAADATTLLAFVHEAQIGDFIVYRSPITNDIRVGRIVGPYHHDPDADHDYVNRRQVRWARRVPVDAFSVEARKALGQQRSFFRLKDHAEEYRAVLEHPAEGWTRPQTDKR